MPGVFSCVTHDCFTFLFLVSAVSDAAAKERMHWVFIVSHNFKASDSQPRRG